MDLADLDIEQRMKTRHKKRLEAFIGRLQKHRSRTKNRNVQSWLDADISALTKALEDHATLNYVLYRRRQEV
jgi:hypothetical protein